MPAPGSTRISAAWRLPEVMHELGVDLADVLDAAQVRSDIFDDPENLISYRELGRLLRACEQRSNCDHAALLIGQRSRLADLGLAGQIALCAETAGDGLKHFAKHFNLQSSASTVSLVASGGYTRFVFAIVVADMINTRSFQLAAMAIARNILQDLCGSDWRPTVVTIASRAPQNLRAALEFFRAPLRFDSGETALVFESHWLDWPLPPVDPLVRRQVAAEVRARQTAIHAGLAAIVRSILRRQLLIEEYSMDDVADLLGMHRRTLDRRLRRLGMRYGELLESVKCSVARQLLRDTRMPVQQVAESLQYSSAANFATAFRRWNGVTPSEYRRAVAD